jgi:hypothetical protein
MGAGIRNGTSVRGWGLPRLSREALAFSKMLSNCSCSWVSILLPIARNFSACNFTYNAVGFAVPSGTSGIAAPIQVVVSTYSQTFDTVEVRSSSPYAYKRRSPIRVQWRLKELEKENAELNRVVAELSSGRYKKARSGDSPSRAAHEALR